MNQAFLRFGVRAYLLLMALMAATAWAQVDDARDQLIQQMLRIVLENNPALASQQELLRETESLRAPRARVALSGVTFSFASSIWDPDTNSYGFYPAATVGASISIADPARALNSFNLAKSRAEARQKQLELKDALITDLLSTVREILKLAAHRVSLEKLKAYLQDYSNLIDKQVRAGAASPELAKLWDLKERLLGVEAEIEDVENQLGTLRLEAALRLAGDSWEELLELFSRLGA
jgi:hypothetical protein